MTTADETRQLANLLTAIRPGWDATSTANYLLPYRRMPLDQLSAAAIRCAQNPTNRTPATLQWMDTQPAESSERSASPNHEPKCYICARTRSGCDKLRADEVRKRAPDPHHFESAVEAERNSAFRQVRDSRVVLGININNPEAAA